MKNCVLGCDRIVGEKSEVEILTSSDPVVSIT